MKTLHDLSIFLYATLMVVAVGCNPSQKNGQAKDAAADATAQPAVPEEQPVPDGHNSRNALDWNGTYQGVIPCADCEGIRTSVTLMKNGEYSRTVTYVGKQETGTTESGTFEWNEAGSKVTLLPGNGAPQQYQVGENVLFHLDREGNRITGDLADKYMLMKNKADLRLENKKWILTELMGQKYTPGENNREAFLYFDGERGRISGSNSCNVINGSYELMEGGRIAMGKVASTMMACPDMETADQFNEVLGKADNYTIADGILSLNRARMAPLARFRPEE
jgi:heat shock protein HslJ